MELQNTLRDLFLARRQPNARLGAQEVDELTTRLGAIEINENEPQEVVEIIPAPAPVEEPDTCTVCLEELTAENTHDLGCGHKAVCKDCRTQMMTQEVGFNGCVGRHPETHVKVIKCPLCRREDTPSREELIAEIVRMRRGGLISRLAPEPVPEREQAVARERARLMERQREIMGRVNPPAVVPVLQPAPAPINAQVAQANLDRAVQQLGGRARAPRARAPRAPRVAPVAQAQAPPNPNALDGDWLRAQNLQPVQLNHQHDNFNRHALIPRWNIMRGHSVATCEEVRGFIAGGEGEDGGWVCGDEEHGVARFYAFDYFVPIQTEGAVPSRRLCGRGAQCTHNQQSRTARRCSRGCGQFICQHCGTCNKPACAVHN